MTEGERSSFNAALAKLRKIEWRDRVLRRVHLSIDVLGEEEAIALLRKIEALL